MKTADFFRARATSLITERREQLQLPYKELALRLSEMGWDVDAKLLAKRINRGTLPFSLAMAVLVVMGEREMTLPLPPAMRQGRPG